MKLRLRLYGKKNAVRRSNLDNLFDVPIVLLFIENTMSVVLVLEYLDMRVLGYNAYNEDGRQKRVF